MDFLRFGGWSKGDYNCRGWLQTSNRATRKVDFIVFLVDPKQRGFFKEF